MLEKRLDTVIETVLYKDADEDVREAFMDGADLHGYVLGEDVPGRWQCEMCGARYDLGALAMAVAGALRGQPVCIGDGLFVSSCPAYGFDLIRPALPDELPEMSSPRKW